MSEATPARRTTFGEVFAVAEFRVLFGSFALLVAGDTVKMLAFSVLIYTRTGSAGLSALAYMSGFIPYVIGGVFLLSLADRMRPRRLMVVGELVRVAVCLALAFAGLPVWAMLALVVTTGALSPVFGAARTAALPELLPGDAFVLGRSVLTVTSAGAQIAGLAAGGAVLTVTGPSGALVITAVLSAASALVLRAGLPDRPPRTVGTAARGPVRATLRVNRRLLADRRVRGLLLSSWIPALCVAGAEAVVVPYLSERGAPSQAGLVLAAFAAGMAAGDFAVGRFAAPALRERLSFPLALALGAPLMGFAARPGLGLCLALAVLAGGCLAYNLGLQRRFVDAVPEETRGQAFGLFTSGQMSGQGLGAALAGALAELVPAHLAIALAGAGATLAALALARHLRPETRPVAGSLATAESIE
ncbi:membrane protein [Sphaerisporangium krabiense]|uniref:Putative MFS family arabinose efflux permease n=1 Tax=Sphaerisporangium krabiense TaxID=763782 RepID=A0A7W8Z5V8_9ACTN|nr:MFS transporter [Sphaerisporangium krabiense]MBB5627889.1 putative MFS family arabinose efflux permease [Sphaerisporangium krabiense]GII62048.1 membrane protein [Sphaerisporangium krabiense]